MLRVSGCTIRQVGVSITTLLLLASVSASGQSLGDVARENRGKKAEAAPNAPQKVITDADLSKDAQGPEEVGPSSKAQNGTPGKAGGGKPAAPSFLNPQAMGQWRSQLLAQKRTVATLEKRLGSLPAHVFSVCAGG